MEYGKVLSFRPTKELEEAIREQAQAEERPLSNMLRILVKRGLAATTKGPDWGASLKPGAAVIHGSELIIEYEEKGK